MVSQRMKIGRVSRVIALCGLALAGGCASSVPRIETASASRFGGDQGRWAEVVFPPPERGGGAEWEFARRDRALSVRGDAPLLATTQWPEPGRASLENVRRVYIRDRDGSYTYFLPDRAPVRRYWSGWDW
ncbi:MAG: hypothetical protein ACK4WH_03750 [Phycisphaerales bacterium]